MQDSHTQILNSLSNRDNLTKLDTLGMMDLVLGFPKQCRDGAAISWQYGHGSTAQTDIRNVVYTGLGGSAIGGDLLRCLADEYGSIPIIVNRDYTLPAWVGPSTLLLAASYSGNTEETLAATTAGLKAEAQIAMVTSGGTLAKIGAAEGCPVAIVPGGQPPRTATGYLFFPALTYLQHRHFLRKDFQEDAEETFLVLEKMAKEYGPDVPVEQNPAKQLAIQLFGKIPVLYGSQGYRGVAAYRWKCQFNENTKIAAFSNVLPEQNHNEILAWVLGEKQASNWSAIFLRDPKEEELQPRIATRVAVTKELVSRTTPVHEIFAQGESLLARLLSIIYMADFVTVYLAYLYGICPTDIGYIDHLKEALAKEVSK